MAEVIFVPASDTEIVGSDTRRGRVDWQPAGAPVHAAQDAALPD